MYLEQKVVSLAKVYAAYFAVLKADVLQTGIA